MSFLILQVDVDEEPVKAITNFIEDPKERMIEQFNSGTTNQKYFAPKKDPPSNNTAPIELKKKVVNPVSESFLKNMNMLKNPNQTQKFIVK